MKSGNRKLLIIAYYYPPSRESGAIRPFGLAKYLRRASWEAVVLTPRMKDRTEEDFAEIIETDYFDVLSEWKRKLKFRPDRSLHEQLRLAPASTKPNSRPMHSHLIGGVKWALAYPDPLRGWLPCATEHIERLAVRGDIAGIISTGPPFVSHMIGKEAKKILKVPWIADFRDLWNTDETTFQDRGGLVGAIQARTERRVLETADALVTVSEPWANQLRCRYRQKKVYAITNGFDIDEISAHESPLTKKFTITHTGMLYEGLRDPSLLLAVLRELVDAGQMDESDLQLQFYGPIEVFLRPMLESFGLEKVSVISAPIPRAEVLKLQRESQLLLLLSWSGMRENGVHTGKVFEYLAARRPILAIGGIRGVLTELLEHTKAGVHALSKEQLRGSVLQAYREYKQNGRAVYRGDANAILTYSHEHMTERFVRLIECLNGPAKYADAGNIAREISAKPENAQRDARQFDNPEEGFTQSAGLNRQKV